MNQDLLKSAVLVPHLHQTYVHVPEMASRTEKSQSDFTEIFWPQIEMEKDESPN